MTRVLDYHSVTCESPCPGWGCECTCHDCPPLPPDDEKGSE